MKLDRINFFKVSQTKPQVFNIFVSDDILTRNRSKPHRKHP